MVRVLKDGIPRCYYHDDKMLQDYLDKQMWFAQNKENKFEAFVKLMTCVQYFCWQDKKGNSGLQSYLKDVTYNDKL